MLRNVVRWSAGMRGQAGSRRARLSCCAGLATALLAGATVVSAQPADGLRELGRAEVRARAGDGRAVALPAILDRVFRSVAGEAVDVRAFDADGSLVYRLLILRPDGQVVSVVVDAARGQILPNSSPVATRVREAARAGRGPGGGAVGRGPSAGLAAGGPGGESGSLQGRGPDGSGPPGLSGDGPGNSGNAGGGGSGGGNGNSGGNSGGGGNGNGNGGGNGNGNGGGPGG